jgi:transposase
MRRFVEGTDRGQWTLLPECLDDWIDENNPVRVIDAFVDALDLAEPGTIKARMGATHFLMKTLPNVASEMALHGLAYNLTRVMNIVGIRPLMAAIGA